MDEYSESNEYYHVESENENYFEVETVNRSAIENEIEGEKHEVYVSAFPFELNVYDTIDEFNKFAGLSDQSCFWKTEKRERWWDIQRIKMFFLEGGVSTGIIMD